MTLLLSEYLVLEYERQLTNSLLLDRVAAAVLAKEIHFHLRIFLGNFKNHLLCEANIHIMQ